MDRMAQEIELKFQIPAARLVALRRAVAAGSATLTALEAAYFDTSGGQLAAARIALRLRQEQGVWVQTLKAEGAGPMHRLEHNVTVPGPDRPLLDPQRHAGSQAGERLQRLLAKAGQPALRQVYATEIQRTHRVLRSGGARIELALDQGCIAAAGRKLPVCEIEFELLDGEPQALLALAGRWVERFGLVLDVRSKSERGHWLAAGHALPPPAAGAPHRPLARPGVQAMLAQALGPVLAHASAWAGEPADPADPAERPTAEHLHQLRVGLRRLRSVLRVFAAQAPAPATALVPALGQLFDRLGAERDRDVMAERLWPALQAAGAPLVALPLLPVSAGALAALLRAAATQRLWLALLAACQASAVVVPPAGADPAAGPVAESAGPLRDSLGPPLAQLLRQVQRDGLRFGALDDPSRHRLRRRIKRLRYAIEASAAVWPARRAARCLAALEKAQGPLGDYHDSVVAHLAYQAHSAVDARAWFAVGWLAARRAALEASCVKALTRLAAARSPFKPA